MNWYIGQEIVCIKSHSKNIVKEGQTFTIKSLSKCCKILIDVGIILSNGSRCRHCGETHNNEGIMWLSERLFAPLMDISELESILNKEQIKEKI